jgi:hypothetical protein
LTAFDYCGACGLLQYNICKVIIFSFMEPLCGIESLFVIRIKSGFISSVLNTIQRDMAAVSLLIITVTYL